MASADGLEDAAQSKGLLSAQRRVLIAGLLKKRGTVTIAELEEEFGISAMTARRDLAALARAGEAHRTHGGAMSLKFSRYEGDFGARVDRNREAKERIARRAAELVSPEDAVFLDASSTAYYIARELLGARLPLTLITSSLPILALVHEIGPGSTTVVATGGDLRDKTLSFVGPHATRVIRSHFADLVFLSVRGLTDDGYLTNGDSLEAETKRAMVEQASRSVLAIDATKFGDRGLNEICDLRRIAIAITDDARAFEERFRFDGELIPA